MAAFLDSEGEAKSLTRGGDLILNSSSKIVADFCHKTRNDTVLFDRSHVEEVMLTKQKQEDEWVYSVWFVFTEEGRKRVETVSAKTAGDFCFLYIGKNSVYPAAFSKPIDQEALSMTFGKEETARDVYAALTVVDHKSETNQLLQSSERIDDTLIIKENWEDEAALLDRSHMQKVLLTCEKSEEETTYYLWLLLTDQGKSVLDTLLSDGEAHTLSFKNKRVGPMMQISADRTLGGTIYLGTHDEEIAQRTFLAFTAPQE